MEFLHLHSENLQVTQGFPNEGEILLVQGILTLSSKSLLEKY